MQTTIARGNISGLFLFAPTLTPVATATSAAEQTFSVVGLNVGDFVEVNSPAGQTAGVGVGSCRVSAQDTLAVIFTNGTGSSATAAAGAYQILVTRPESNGPAATSLA